MSVSCVAVLLVQVPRVERAWWGDILPWLVAALALIPLLLRTPRGERASWFVVGGALLLILTDKVVDLQTLVHHQGQAFVHALDPELRLRGDHLWMRYLLLGGLALGAGLGIAVMARRDRRLDLPKGLALLGLAGIVAFLGARQLPGLKGLFTEQFELLVEGTCFTLVVVGELLAFGRGRPVRGEGSQGA